MSIKAIFSSKIVFVSLTAFIGAVIAGFLGSIDHCYGLNGKLWGYQTVFVDIHGSLVTQAPHSCVSDEFLMNWPGFILPVGIFLFLLSWIKIPRRYHLLIVISVYLLYKILIPGDFLSD